jgi:hypothetical protein
MTISYQLVNQNLNDAPTVFAAQVDTVLQGLGSIGLQDVFLTRREGLAQRLRLQMTLSYTTAGPLAVRATAFSGVNGDVDTQAAAFLAANPTYRVLFIRDIGSSQRGALDDNVIMLIYATTVLSNCGQDRSRPVIVEALGNILAGASGSVQLVGAAGLVAGGVITAINRFDSTWATGKRGYAQVRPGSCLWDGYPTCC